MDLSIHNVTKTKLVTKTLTHSDGNTFKLLTLEVFQGDKVDYIQLFVEDNVVLELESK